MICRERISLKLKKKKNIYKYGLSWNTAEDIERLVVDLLKKT
jgi:hypothetical protein